MDMIFVYSKETSFYLGVGLHSVWMVGILKNNTESAEGGVIRVESCLLIGRFHK
jgi:hypothetical protein